MLNSISRYKQKLRLVMLLLILLSATAAFAQTTGFTYQGRLTDGGTPANGTYDLQFKLFDLLTGGTQQPQPTPITVERTGVQVTSGIFTVQLDFGANAFPGGDRYLEISVRHNSGESYTLLTPRQPITSTPYSLRSLNATTADTSTNATQLGGVAANQYVQTNDSRLSDARPPTPGSSEYIQNTAGQQSAANFNIGGDGTAGGTLSGNIINSDTQYNIGGGRVLSVGGSFNLFLGFGTGASNTTGFGNSFFGFQAGETNDTGTANSFFGYQSGNKNSNGNSNSFFGSSAGASNTSGGSNSFFGSGAGGNNLTGEQNSFFGSGAGLKNTASGNSFFGASAGLNNVNGFDNSFFGKEAGQFNSTGIFNSFFGVRAGNANTSGARNSFFGWSAGTGNQGGTDNSFFGYFAGFKNLNGSSNSFFGNQAGKNNTSGSTNSFFGPSAGINNISGTGNTFLGSAAGIANTIEDDNTFIGHLANGAATITNATAIGANASVIQSNSLVLGSGVNVGIGTSAPGQKLEVAGNVKVSGTGNGFIFSDGSSMTTAGLTTASGDVRYAQLAAANSFNGNQSVTGTISATGAVNAGTQYNIAGSRVMSNTGTENMFVGSGSGNANSGSFGSFFGNNAGQHNTSGDGNSFFGDSAGQINITGQYNSFFGTNAGQNNSGSYNSFFGGLAGQGNTSGSGNTVVGELAGLSNTTENNNTFIGYQANGFAGITNATAIGANASVTQSNSVVLGNNVNVGIGLTKPLAKLDLQGGADSDGSFDPKAIALSYRSGGYRHWIRTRHNSAGISGNAIDFFTNTAPNADGSSAPGVGNQLVMSLNGSNVGVGTNDPKAKLHVQGGNIFVAQPNSLIITSPNGLCWQIKVSDLGALTAASVTCPN